MTDELLLAELHPRQAEPVEGDAAVSQLPRCGQGRQHTAQRWRIGEKGGKPAGEIPWRTGEPARAGEMRAIAATLPAVGGRRAPIPIGQAWHRRRLVGGKANGGQAEGPKEQTFERWPQRQAGSLKEVLGQAPAGVGVAEFSAARVVQGREPAGESQQCGAVHSRRKGDAEQPSGLHEVRQTAGHVECPAEWDISQRRRQLREAIGKGAVQVKAGVKQQCGHHVLRERGVAQRRSGPERQTVGDGGRARIGLAPRPDGVEQHHRSARALVCCPGSEEALRHLGRRGEGGIR